MPASPYVSRVNQIDAVQLDEEIYKVLRNQVKEITKYQSIEKIDRWQPEIDAVLKYFIWNFSLRHGKSTFGQQLLNLHYENITGAKSLLYLILTIGPAYVRDKFVDSGTNRNLTLLLDRLANVAKLLDFINLLIFLHRGTQPRIVEYLLGIASRSVTTHKPRNIGYSYMTRELLWHGLMELFTTGLPMINLHYFKHTFQKMFTQKKHVDLRRSFPKMDSSSKCAYCADTPILPMHAGCPHIFCYYCLKAHFTAVDEFQCPECSTRLHVAHMKTYQTNSSVPS
ncbi:Peroxisome biogenesis factor 2 [Habropoda laboriosa]|uniref:RING-type E3 ubiquitin transferase (cysteine targeting) n=2 Tax=Habropoda laboriosa TaxID=597456 RepID=A0A0L7R5B0_9HYME|nr:Peroxisome biogenesis factor 2 [Habropoda laboriosa]